MGWVSRLAHLFTEEDPLQHRDQHSTTRTSRRLTAGRRRTDARRFVRRHGGEGGTVTAESAVVLPLVAAFALALIWMVTIGLAKVQTVDAARDAARALARGDDRGAAVAAAELSAPAGARVSVDQSGSTVSVTVSADADAPSWLLVALPTRQISSTATVQVEDGTAE
ncbi:MAG: TadE family type IV pilus minor pilin [Nocardioidaceae bacterium]